MIELFTSYSFSNVPYISEDALDAYGERIVADFAPELVHTPGILDVDRFVEFYLGLSPKYHRLSYHRKVLGMTAFEAGFLDIIDEDTGLEKPLYVVKGTVIIDTSLTKKEKDIPRLRFTTMHEAAHWLLHRKAFERENPMGLIGAYENRFLAAKTGTADYARGQKEKNDIDRMEHQADFLTSAILLPKPALRTAYRQFFSYYGENPRRIIRGSSVADNCYAELLPKYVQKLFGVSKAAARIRLEKLTAIVDARTWRGAR